MRFAAINFELIHAAVKIAKRDGLLVSLDLASFEVYTLKKIIIVLLMFPHPSSQPDVIPSALMIHSNPFILPDGTKP